MVSTSAVTGCCAAYNFYNLGGAHGIRTAKNQDEFDEWLSRCGVMDLNFAITNSAQVKTRTYLEAAGWETKKVGRIWISTISGQDLRTHKIKTQLRMAEQRKLKEAERLKQYETQRALQKEGKFAPTPISTQGVYPGKVYELGIRQLCGNILPTYRHPEHVLACKDSLEKHYRIKLHDWDIQYYNNWEILRRKIYKKVHQAREIERARIKW